MSDPRALRILHDTLRHLDHPLRFALRHHELARRIRHYLGGGAAARLRPAAILRARDCAMLVPGVSIDADETVTRASTDGIEVRAWFLVPSGGSPVEDPDNTARIVCRLKALPPLTREIFCLHRAEGLSFGDVAARLRISERQVRRHMLRAIRQLARQR